MNRYHRTSSFNLATFLLAKGLELVNVCDSEDPRRKEFVFRNTPEVEALINLFNFGAAGQAEVMVDARQFIACTRALKEKLYSQNF